MPLLTGVYPGFRNIKWLEVFLLPPGWDVSPSQGYLPELFRRYPVIHLGGERGTTRVFPQHYCAGTQLERHYEGYPPALLRRYPVTHLCGERHYESKVSCPRTQHNSPGQGSNPDRLIRSPAHLAFNRNLLNYHTQLKSVPAHAFLEEGGPVGVEE